MLCYVLPRGTRYSRSSATSIDLFVSEMAAHGRCDSRVIAETVADPLPGPSLIEAPAYRFARTARRAVFSAGAIGRMAPDAVLVQQYAPAAFWLNALARRPTVLQKHGYYKTAKTRRGLSWGTGALNALSGLTFVSDAALSDFEANWPDVRTPRTVIFNGFARREWRPRLARDREVLVVGRATPEKGILEAAAGLAIALADRPDWSARFILAEEKARGAYLDRVRDAVGPLGPRASIQLNAPFARVKAAFERAAIAVVPSKCPEGFGRTCLEAHAGGAAVISSGAGGLRSVSGDCALYIDPEDPRSIAGAVRALISDVNLREGLVKRGTERVGRLFDLDRIAAKLEAFCLSPEVARRGAGR